MTALDRIEELAQHATRWTVVVTRNNHRSFYNEEVEAEVVLEMVECIRAAKEMNVPSDECAIAFDAALSKLEQMK